MWSEEKKREVGQIHRTRLASLSADERRARTEVARAAARAAAVRKRHLRWAAEMREAGWSCVDPDAAREEDDKP